MKNPILILLPSLNRPNQLSDAIASLVKESTGLADILVIGGEGGVISAFNSVPHELLSRYKIVGMFGDDVRMKTPKWDVLVLSKLGPGKTGLIYGRDGHQDSVLCTHPFVSTGIFHALGFIYPPELHHFCGDNFLMELLKPIGKVEYVPELFTDHLHPDAGKSPLDDTYRKSGEWWLRDLAVWREYREKRLADDRQRVTNICP
jgi:hypothetical protein